MELYKQSHVAFFLHWRKHYSKSTAAKKLKEQEQELFSGDKFSDLGLTPYMVSKFAIP